MNAKEKYQKATRCSGTFSSVVHKRREQPAAYVVESEKIKENKKKYEGTVHKFTAAKWTHPNGHPRCLLCGDEESFSPECGRDATPEEEAKVRESWGFDSVTKSVVNWDGDGVQGAGQPRDREGRWVALPGPTDVARVGMFELDDGTFGVFTDDNRRPMRKLKDRSKANKVVRDLIVADRDAFVEREAERKKQSTAAKRRATIERKKQEAAAQSRREAEEARVARDKEIFGTPKPIKGSAEQVPQLGPKGRSNNKVSVGEMDRLPFPGKPSQTQLDGLKEWKRTDLKDSEAKYVDLLGRLLMKKGITQDPKVRGAMAAKYGVSSKRLADIEGEMHERLFPKNAPKQRKVDYSGGAGQPPRQQIESAQKLGARSVFPEASPSDAKRPARYVKITKGPSRGKYAKINWNGTTSLVDEKEFQDNRAKSKVAWTKRLLADKEAAEVRRQKYKAQQARLAAADSPDERREQKKQRIKAAQEWARKNGLDETDSYWWAFYHNDPTLLSGATEDGLNSNMGFNQLFYELANEDPEEYAKYAQDIANTVEMGVGLSQLLEDSGFDPAILEGILALPDISHQDMRGHRPNPRRSMPGDDDFVEASAESRRDDEQHAARNARRARLAEEKAQAAYERYMQRHPKSKKTYGEWKNDVWNQKSRIPGGGTTGLSKSMNPSWDGDGVQGVGQRRGRDGRWSGSGRAAVSALGEIEQAMQHTEGTGRRAGAKSPGTFDHRNKTIGSGMKIKKPQKGSTHQGMVGDVPVRRGRKQYTPEEAYYARNNGPTAIDNKRLKAIYEDRTKITSQEHDLITAATGDVNFDGDSKITFSAVRYGGERRTMTRNMVIKELRTQLRQDFAKKNNLGEKGAGGQRRVNEGTAAREQNEKDNVKRAGNNRNAATSLASRKQLLDDFGVNGKAKCIFCGRPVGISTVSPERMKPGGIGGKYERGNMAPAHAACNTNSGNGISAQHKPDEYYEKMLELFKKRYAEWIPDGHMDFVFKHHRGKLRKR